MEGEGEVRKSAELFQAISYASDELFSTAAQTHFFFDLGFKSAHKYWNSKLKEMALYDAWPISKNYSNGGIMAEVSPFQHVILLTLCWPCVEIVVLTTIQFLEVDLVGFSFESALLTVSCCSAKGLSTSLLHRPPVLNLQDLFLYCFKVFQDFYHSCYKTSYETQSSSCTPLFFLLLEHTFSAQHN